MNGHTIFPFESHIPPGQAHSIDAARLALGALNDPNPIALYAKYFQNGDVLEVIAWLCRFIGINLFHREEKAEGWVGWGKNERREKWKTVVF